MFADDYCNSPFIHTQLIDDLSLDLTLHAKISFERSTVNFRVNIKHYRGDNGYFRDKRLK